MLYHLSLYLHSYYGFFRVVQYVSFRAMAALMTVLTLSFLFGSWYIRFADKFFRSGVRPFTPDSHKLKGDTPTMGGLFMAIVVGVTTLLWCDITDVYVQTLLLALVLFAGLGFWDDYRKVMYKRGITERQKWFGQLFAGSAVLAFWYLQAAPSTQICIPLFKDLNPDLGWLFYPWALFIIVATCNAVNLTDGLDGLALSALLPNFATYGIISYCTGHFLFSHYLHVPFVGTAEVAIVCVILIGSCLGFLWYNSYPAQIFMGDVGALFLGALLGLIALMTKQELLLAISAGVCVGETLSVIAQVFWVKVFKRRLFKIAPIHHHYEKLGWPETKITVRAGIVSIILCLIALMFLKIR